MKNKLISISIIAIFIFTSLLSVEAIAPTPKVELDDYQLTITDKNNVYISGTVSVCVGQDIGVFDSNGKIMYNSEKLQSTNKKSTFKLKIPSRYLNDGKNTFKIKSTPVKNVINGSNPKTLTVTVNPVKVPDTNTNTNNTPTITTYAITYNSNGGKGTMTKTTAKTGNNAIISKNKFTRDGYRFTGWATSKNGNVVYAENKVIKLTKNMTLYAVWMKKPPARVKPGKHKCYVIEVDLTNQICTVYDCYTNGTRNPIMSEWVSTGKKGRGKTPVGTWKIGKNSKGRAKYRTAKMSSGKSYAEFFVRFKSAKGFHTVPCKTRQTKGKVSKSEFNKLGTPRSAGYYPMGKPKRYKATSNYDPTR